MRRIQNRKVSAPEAKSIAKILSPSNPGIYRADGSYAGGEKKGAASNLIHESLVNRPNQKLGRSICTDEPPVNPKSYVGAMHRLNAAQRVSRWKAASVHLPQRVVVGHVTGRKSHDERLFRGLASYELSLRCSKGRLTLNHLHSLQDAGLPLSSRYVIAGWDEIQWEKVALLQHCTRKGLKPPYPPRLFTWHRPIEFAGSCADDHSAITSPGDSYS
ncbi:hypothetical protein BX600DRAFT_434029 [Xylariales sp. PMI_506]|nr:hypothetical protein BX600DRAFT_434029 [Xylariales sp. PMI_506]